MIKLNLSNAYDITNLNQKYNLNNLYLGYIKGRGYIFINEVNNKAFFTPIKSDNEPMFLNVNWQHDSKEIKVIYSELDKILKDYISKTLAGVKGDYTNKIVNGVYVDIVAELLHSLSDKTISYNYVKVKDINNKDIKELALNPVDNFNFYLNYDNTPLSSSEFYAARESTELKIKHYLNEAINVFNNDKGIMGYTDIKKTKINPIITENRFIHIFNEIISDSLNNPLLNIKFGNGKAKLNTIEGIDYITDEFNIKGSYNNGTENVYYFNDELNYFEKLTEEKLKNIVSDKLGFKLLKSDYSKLHSSVETNTKEYNNILVFKNILFDMDYMEELNFPLCNYKRTDYLAPSLIGFENDEHQIELLNYDMDFDFLEIYNTNPDPTEMTFTEKTLRQILIPKDEPNNLQGYHDFLQRLGSCILGKNKYKVITLYYGAGNNGKGILKLVMELIFNRGAYSLTPATFDETFNLQGFTNRKVLLLDEIDKNDFKDLKPTLKRISSPEGRIEQRAMYSTENIILNNFPNLFIFSNVLISLDMSETALFDRFDFLKLPNSFVSEKELNKIPNSYPKDRNTEAKIKADVKGLSWLITASIKAFVDMENHNNEFVLKQTASQTMDILAETDHLTKFISLYTYKDLDLVPNECTTNEEILQQFKQYLELTGNTTSETDVIIKRRIGTVIKQVYDIEGKISKSEIYTKINNTVAGYRIKLKSFDDLNKELREVYIINEDISEENYNLVNYSNDNKMVYNKIQEGINTINLLNKEFPNLDNYKIVRELLNLNLIIKTSQMNLSDRQD